jgi:hypothetical protein
VERVKRIDARAQAIVNKERPNQQAMKSPDFKSRAVNERLEIRGETQGSGCGRQFR